MFENQMRRALMRGSALALVAGYFALSGPAFAQSSTYAFDVPAEPLSKALHDYSAISGQQIIFSDDDVAGKTAPALRGEYSSNEALNMLLAGTGLVADRSASGGVMVRSKNARAALDEGAGSGGAETVTVTGTRVTRAGFETPAPTTVVTATDLRVSGNSNLADSLDELPSMSVGLTPSAAP
ncbi:MAG TPA: STN domain-containing protein, partial [Afipia sp.]